MNDVYEIQIIQKDYPYLVLKDELISNEIMFYNESEEHFDYPVMYRRKKSFDLIIFCILCHILVFKKHNNNDKQVVIYV